MHRKLLLVDVLQCAQCGLMFRYPKNSVAENRAYYQQQYDSFEQGIVTTLPAPDEARAMAGRGFAGTPWHSPQHVAILQKVKPVGRMLDYGCSWGYFIVQARQAGYEASGFEISRSRAQFGRSVLQVECSDDPAMLATRVPESLDIVYTSHVLEHLPDLRTIFAYFARSLKPDGVLLIFVPNCGGSNAKALGPRWGPFVNEAHTISFDASFFERNLPEHGFSVTCTSDPYDGFLSRGALHTTGDELMFLARKR